MKKTHDDRQERDGMLTPNQLESEKEQLEWRDYVAMMISALIVIVPVALLVLLLLAVSGYFFIVR